MATRFAFKIESANHPSVVSSIRARNGPSAASCATCHDGRPSLAMLNALAVRSSTRRDVRYLVGCPWSKASATTATAWGSGTVAGVVDVRCVITKAIALVNAMWRRALMPREASSCPRESGGRRESGTWRLARARGAIENSRPSFETPRSLTRRTPPSARALQVGDPFTGKLQLASRSHYRAHR